MSKAPQTPLSRTSRLLDLVPYITAHQGIDLTTLAQVFSVTPQQMVADLTTLWMCGLPGYTPLELMELSFDSGYVTIHNAQTLSRPRNLTMEECVALLLGLDLIMQSLPEDREDLKSTARTLVAKLSLRANISSPLHAQSLENQEIRACVLAAISSKSKLTISYHSLYSDEVSTRVIQPVELRSDQMHEYVWAYCEKALAFRSFRVDRLLTCEVADMPSVQIHATEDLDSPFIYYSLHVSSRLRDVMERFNLEVADMSSTIHSRAYSRQWLSRSVVASAGVVELTEPPEIRAEIAGIAALLLQKYGQT